MNRTFWLVCAALAGALAVGCDNGNGAQTDAGSDVVVDAGPGKAVLSDTSVDFGGADCGGQAPAAKTITLQNTGAGPLTWSAKLEATDAFELSGATGGTVGPNGSAQITINAKAIASSATAGQHYLTALTVTTSDPNLSTASVPVSISAQGATLSLVPNVADFGLYTVQQQAPDIALTLVNTGNKDATVTFDTPADAQFTIDWTGAPTGATVAAGGSPMAGLKARFKATNITATSSFSSIHVTGTGVCGASATKVDLKGQGTNGALVYSPGTLDFGLTDCGTAALSQTFTIANTGNAPLTWTAAMSNGAIYKLSGYGGVLFPQTQQVVTVMPGPIPIPSDVTANLYGATITLTTDASGDTPHTVTLEETAHGAILTTNTNTIDYTASGKPGDTKTLTVNNVGNEDVPVYLSGSAPPPPPCPTCPPFPPMVSPLNDLVVTPTTSPTKVVANGNQNFVLDVEPHHLGPLSSQIYVLNDWNSPTVLCKPLPSAVNVSGTISTTASAIDVRYNEACAVTAGNRAFCWGQADQYLGEYQSLANTRNVGLTSVSLTATNANDFNGICAADTSGSVSCHVYGVQNNILSGVSQLTSANGQFCALASGAVSCWKGGTSMLTQTVASKAVSIAMGGSYNQPILGVVMNDGSLWAGSPWGPLSPQMGFSSVASAAFSEVFNYCFMPPCGHTCALDTNGAVWCMGTNQYGEVNGMPSPPVMSPVQVNDTDGVTPITGALAVTAGQFHTCVIRSDHTVVCFGDNGNGELGIGNTSFHAGVVQAGTLNDAQDIKAGTSHTCVVRTTGDVSCWGQNFNAQSAATSSSPPITSPTALPYL